MLKVLLLLSYTFISMMLYEAITVKATGRRLTALRLVKVILIVLLVILGKWLTA